MALVMSSVGTRALALATVVSAAGLGDDGIEHLHNEALLSARQLLDALDLLLQLRCRAALLGRGGIVPEQLLQRHRERTSECRQRRDWNPPASDFVGIPCYRWGPTTVGDGSYRGRTGAMASIYIERDSDYRAANEILIKLGAAQERPLRLPTGWMARIALILLLLALVGCMMLLFRSG